MNRILCVSLTGLGIVGNTSVFMNYVVNFGKSTKNKLIHLILTHLVFTNIIMLLSKGVPKTTAAFGIRNFLDETGCKIVCFLEWVARGLSICTTTLLTVVQAITMNPRHSWWRKLKLEYSRYILALLLFFWVLNSLIGMNLFNSITDIRINSSQIYKSDNYCYYLPKNREIEMIFLTLMVLRDVVFQGAMGWASGYMIFLLHKHHQHVLYLQNSKLLYKTPPEIKAAQSVLFLMFCFLFFYWTDCVLTIVTCSTLDNHSMAINVREFLTLCYSVLSPLVLIHREGHLADCLKDKETLRKFFHC
ncbi:putative vomeronasal receptor-like protein 4 [Ctenodactylus gundi]